MHRAELLGWLNSSNNLRAKMEECLTEKQGTQDTTPAPPSSESAPRDFNKAVHSWNPQEKVFSRSLKE